MYEALFTVFGLEVRPFSACVFPGVCAASVLFLFLCSRRGLDRAAGEKCLMLAIPLGVFSGHLLNCLVLPTELIPDFGWQILFSPWMGGYMFYGAAAGACAAVSIAAGRQKKQMLDLMALSLLTVILFVRFAEPLDGQGNGIPLDDVSPWRFFPVAFPDPEWPDEWNLAVFFWEGAYALGVLVYLLATLKKRAPGDTALTALILYAAGQVILESLRRDQTVRWLFVRVSQLASALILAFIVFASILHGLRGRKGALLMGLTVLFILCIVGLEFAVEKPLALPGGTLIYFSLPVTYSLIALCAFGLGAAAMTAKGTFFPKETRT